MHVLSAFGNFGRRIVSQPVIPGMKSGLAAADGIILIARRVVLLGELVQRCSRSTHALIFESVGIDTWSRLCDQRLVRNVGVALRRRLRRCDAHCEPYESNEENN